MDLLELATFYWSQDYWGGIQSLTVQVDGPSQGKSPCLVLITERWEINPGELEAFFDRLRWCAAQVQQNEPAKESK